MKNTDFSNYTSVFSWRYGSPEMRELFSEENKYRIWRKIWVALATAQNKAGLVSKEELEDLVTNEKNIDIEKILKEEEITKHDVVAAIREFAGKATVGGGKIHLGATSMDIVDNADTLKIRDAINLVEKKLVNLLHLFSKKIEAYADLPCIGYTHLQPAEPTTVGYRLAFYAQDLLIDYQLLQFVKNQLKGKGLKGAVGTQASYTALLSSSTLIEDPDSRLRGNDKSNPMTVEQLEKEVMNKLGIEPFLISTQVSTRKVDYVVLTCLASIASSLAKFAGDLRILQSPPIGEWSEPFGKTQVGSSAMPYKKNPINSEKICSLARYVSALPAVALENASLSYLERTLDDSANKRVIIPEAFLAIDEILQTAEKIIDNIVINEKKIAFNLNQYAPFVATEGIIIEAVKAGADRQEMHETLREISLKAWDYIQEGKPNPMATLLLENQDIQKYVKKENIQKLLDVNAHIGTASERSLKLASQLKIIK